LRAPDGKTDRAGYHTGHWEIGLLVQAAAESFTGCQASLLWLLLRTLVMAGRKGAGCSQPSVSKRRRDYFRRLAVRFHCGRRAWDRDLRQRTAADDDGFAGCGNSCVIVPGA